MEFLVKVSGNVVNRQDKTYVISAKNQAEALNTANTSFENEYEYIDITSSVKPYKRTLKAIICLAFLFIAITLSCIEWKDGHSSVSIQPDYISSLYSVLFYTAFVMRFKGIQRATSSWIDVVSGIGVILLMSSFIQTMLFSGTLNIFGITEIEVNMKIILPVAIFLSWAGLKFISIICMLAIGIMALFSITSLNNAMGAFWGTLYILSSYLGVVFYLSVEPVAVETLSQLKAFAQQSLSHTKEELLTTKKVLSQLSQKNVETHRNSDENPKTEENK